MSPILTHISDKLYVGIRFLYRDQARKTTYPSVGMSPFCVCQMESDSPLSAVPVFVDEIEHLLTVAREFGAEVLVVI